MKSSLPPCLCPLLPEMSFVDHRLANISRRFPFSSFYIVTLHQNQINKYFCIIQYSSSNNIHLSIHPNGLFHPRYIWGFGFI